MSGKELSHAFQVRLPQGIGSLQSVENTVERFNFNTDDPPTTLSNVGVPTFLPTSSSTSAAPHPHSIDTHVGTTSTP